MSMYICVAIVGSPVLCKDKLYTICCCSDIVDNRKVKVYVKGYFIVSNKTVVTKQLPWVVNTVLIPVLQRTFDTFTYRQSNAYILNSIIVTDLE